MQLYLHCKARRTSMKGLLENNNNAPASPTSSSPTSTSSETATNEASAPQPANPPTPSAATSSPSTPSSTPSSTTPSTPSSSSLPLLNSLPEGFVNAKIQLPFLGTKFFKIIFVLRFTDLFYFFFPIPPPTYLKKKGATYQTTLPSDLSLKNLKVELMKTIVKSGAKNTNPNSYFINIRGLRMLDEAMVLKQFVKDNMVFVFLVFFGFFLSGFFFVLEINFLFFFAIIFFLFFFLLIFSQLV